MLIIICKQLFLKRVPILFLNKNKKNSHNIQRLVFSFMPEAVALGVKNSKSHKCKQSGWSYLSSYLPYTMKWNLLATNISIVGLQTYRALVISANMSHWFEKCLAQSLIVIQVVVLKEHTSNQKKQKRLFVFINCKLCVTADNDVILFFFFFKCCFTSTETIS